MGLTQLLNRVKLSNFRSQTYTVFWFCLSLAVPLYFGLIALSYAFSGENIIQDDARQHVVWLQRFVDPQLFPNDLIANYFQTVDPAGFKFIYWVFAKLGIEPILLYKVLPVILGLITSGYVFAVYLEIFPVPAGAFLAVLLLNQALWLKDDLVSATPRAFLFPLFAAFLYYYLKRSLIPYLITIALQGLFFPQLLLVQVAILLVSLVRWENGVPQLKNNYLFELLGLIVAAIVLVPFALNTSEFGTVVTAAQMKTMPEFGFRGRSQYFGVDPLSFVFNGSSGLRAPLFPPILWMSVWLPVILRSRSPLVRLVTREIRILWQTVLASLGMFFLAHLFLLKLYFPDRYTSHSSRFVMAIAAAVVLTVWLDAGWRWLQHRLQVKSPFTVKHYLVIGLVGIVAIASLVVPAVPSIFLKAEIWVIGNSSKIYTFLANQPKDILIASLVDEANNIPAFSQRSILAGGEFAFAYHPLYYNQFKQRAVDTIRATYSSDLSEVKQIIQKYGIDFFMISDTLFRADFLSNQRWLFHSSFRSTVLEAIAQLKQGEKPILKKLRHSCTVISVNKLSLVDAACVLKTKLKPIV